jgi:hypothetical protein
MLQHDLAGQRPNVTLKRDLQGLAGFSEEQIENLKRFFMLNGVSRSGLTLCGRSVGRRD